MADADTSSENIPSEDDPETFPDTSGSEASAAETLPPDVSAGEAVTDGAFAEEASASDVAGIKHVHESSGHPSPTTHPQVSKVMQGIRNDSGRQEALPRTEAAPLVSSDLKQALEVLPGSGAAPPRSETATYARWLRGLRDRALLLLGFATAPRPREFASVEKKNT